MLAKVFITRHGSRQFAHGATGGRLTNIAGSAILILRVHRVCPSIWDGRRLQSMVAASAATGSIPLTTSRQNQETECREPREGGEMPLQIEGA
jgi:hypothetical protein